MGTRLHSTCNTGIPGNVLCIELDTDKWDTRLCDSSNVLCGQLHCAGGNFMNNVGVKSNITVITARTRSGAPCR